MFDRIAQAYRGSLAVVIGAGGIGVEIARLLSESGAHVVVADQSLARLEQLQILAEHGSLIARPLDVCDDADVEQFFEYLYETVGVPHFLFYTAGVLNIEPLGEIATSDWLRAVDVNLNGVFRCVRLASAKMSAAKRGSILILGSIAGTKARSGSRVNPVYNTTKAGIAAFVNAAAMQLRASGVRINCISPGPTATSMMDVQPPQVHAAVRDITLDHRLNQPVEVAELALFVAAHGRFTGEDLGMGGGAGLGG